MRVSRRTIIARLFGAAVLGVAATSLLILDDPANAQGNGNGGGNGNGNSGNGNGGGNGNNGNGTQGGNGKGKGISSGSASLSSDASPANPARHASVVHQNGMSESVAGGRYEMHDAKGRLIIRRQANDRRRFTAPVRTLVAPIPRFQTSPQRTAPGKGGLKLHRSIRSIAGLQLGKDGRHMMLYGLLLQVQSGL